MCSTVGNTERPTCAGARRQWSPGRERTHSVEIMVFQQRRHVVLETDMNP